LRKYWNISVNGLSTILDSIGFKEGLEQQV
jgi:hypothetical protein